MKESYGEGLASHTGPESCVGSPPYGDLFAVRLDGAGLTRLTHNGFEEGTPAWGPAVELRPSGESAGDRGSSY